MIKLFQQIVATIDNKIDLATSDLVIVFDGDSLTRGFNNAGIEQYYPKEVNAYLDGKANTKEFYSYGVGGQAILNMLNDASTQIYPKAKEGKENVLIAWADVNSILNDGRTAMQTFNDFETYFSGAKNAGFQHCIIITSYYPRVDGLGNYNQPQWGSRIPIQEEYFDLVKNANINNQSWDYSIDLRNVDIIGGEKEQLIDGVYFEDSVHLNAIGYDLIADRVIEELNKIFKIMLNE